jgi:hypothetical protein
MTSAHRAYLGVYAGGPCLGSGKELTATFLWVLEQRCYILLGLACVCVCVGAFGSESVFSLSVAWTACGGYVKPKESTLAHTHVPSTLIRCIHLYVCRPQARDQALIAYPKPLLSTEEIVNTERTRADSKTKNLCNGTKHPRPPGCTQHCLNRNCGEPMKPNHLLSSVLM